MPIYTKKQLDSNENINEVFFMLKKGYKGIGMNGIIAKWYAKTVEKDYKEYEELANRIRKILDGKKDILEVAPGPGYLSIELAKHSNFNVTGMDISETFVQIANEKAKEQQVSANFVVGNASQMPFKEKQFDFIVCRAAFKNFSEPLQAINEMFRVLKEGGRALIIDLRKDVKDEAIHSYVRQMNLNKVDQIITKWTFKNMLIKRAYSIEQIKQLANRSNFSIFRIDETSTGFELWLEK